MGFYFGPFGKMNRFFSLNLEPTHVGGVIVLEGGDVWHGAGVLRLGQGDPLIVSDGAGTDYICQVKSANKSQIEAAVTEIKPNTAEPSVKVYLFQSLIKSDRLEYAAQKAVELGVSGIFPFQAERSVVRLNNASAKSDRLQKIVQSAAMQSGRGIIPKVANGADFEAALFTAVSLKPDIMLAAHEKSSLPLKELLLNNKSALSAAVFIGPEGGFSDSEIGAFEKRGIQAFSLGKRILRAETAGLAALANIMYDLEG